MSERDSKSRTIQARVAEGVAVRAELAPIRLPRQPEIGDDYEIWLKYLRQIEKLEPHDHPALQAARRSTRSIVRRKVGFGPQLESNALRAFNFDACRTRSKRRTGRTSKDDTAKD